MNSTALRSTALILIALLMASTRLNLPMTATHLGPIPDASWAAFFIGGFYLRGWGKWAFPALMALAVGVDYLVISGQGLSFWDHYCVSAAYWFLVPAYFALWMGGSLARRAYRQTDGRALGVLTAALIASVTLCHLLSQGSFYWISDVVAQPTVAGWWKNFSDWYLPYLRTSAIYVGLAIIVHVGVEQTWRLTHPRKATR
jgi:hypothetical protein